MKKIKYILLSAFAVTALVGCVGNKGGGGGNLPSGGKTYDLNKVADVQEVTSKAKSTIRNTFGLAKGLTLTNEIQSASINANVRTVVDQKNVTAGIGINNLKGKTEFAISDFTSSAKTVDLRMGLSNWGGNVTLKASVPQGLISDMPNAININSGFTFNDVSAAAYFNNGDFYIDASSDGLRGLLTSLNSAVDGVAGSMANAMGATKDILIQQMIIPLVQQYTGVQLTKLDLNEFLDKFTGSVGRKYKLANTGVTISTIPVGFDIETIAAYVDQYLPIAINALKSMDLLNLLTVKQYDDGKFGVQLTITKEALMKLLQLLGGTSIPTEVITLLNKNLSSFNITLSLLTDSSMKLASISLSQSLAFSGEITSLVTTTKIPGAIYGARMSGTSNPELTNAYLDISDSISTVFTIQAGSNTSLPADASTYQQISL